MHIYDINRFYVIFHKIINIGVAQHYYRKLRSIRLCVLRIHVFRQCIHFIFYTFNIVLQKQN